MPALIFTTFISLAVLFQVALALGAPWGHLAMGGKFPGKFPPGMRVAALVQAAILAIFAVIVLVRAHILLPGLFPIAELGIWVVVAISAVSFMMNLLTPSFWERVIWAPTGAILLVCSTLVALS